MKKLVSLLFHRVVLVAFFLLIQVAVLVVMLLRFNNYFLPFYGVCVAISLFAVFWIVGRQSDPAHLRRVVLSAFRRQSAQQPDPPEDGGNGPKDGGGAQTGL